MKKSKELSASEALFGFGAWLTARSKPITFGATYNAGPMAQLINEFSRANNLNPPRNGWNNLLVMPNE